MKRILAICLCVLMAAGAMSACQSNKSNSSSQSPSSSSPSSSTPSISSEEPDNDESKPVPGENSLKAVIDQIRDEIGMQMPAELDDKVLEDIFHVNPDDLEEYYGLYGMSITTSDNLVGVLVKPDKKDAVVEALTKRREDVQKSFEQYLQDQYEKAKKGVIYEKGDYVFLIIIGSSMETIDDDVARAKEIIDEAFGA